MAPLTTWPSITSTTCTSTTIILHLSLPQIILCPLLGAVTYIDESRKNRTFR